jgi:hypothetical protein
VTLYKLLQDQGSIIAGILAVLAGLVAYCAGRQQVRAVEDQTEAVRNQNEELKRSERRRLARETLIAIRLFDGILATVAHNIDAIPEFGNDSRELGLNGTNGIRRKLAALMLDPVIDQLGNLNREFIDAISCFALKSITSEPRPGA